MQGVEGGGEGGDVKGEEKRVERVQGQRPRSLQRKKQIETEVIKGTGHTDGQKLRPERLGTAEESKQVPGPRSRLKGKYK